MFQNKNEIKEFLHRNRILPQKSLGQNFLIDEKILDKIVNAAELDSGYDRVLEIGAGPGILSQVLAPKVLELTAVEIDASMIPVWHKAMSGFKNVKLVNQDILHYLPRDLPYKLVANIPYYISSPILQHFLRNPQVRRPDLIVLMMQKDVALRICDRKKPSYLSWLVRVFATPEIICNVPANSFYPAPKVESAVIKLNMLASPQIETGEQAAFFDLLEMAYRQPRKTLANNLNVKHEKSRVQRMLADSGLTEKVRAHQLDIENWKRLFTSWKGS